MVPYRCLRSDSEQLLDSPAAQDLVVKDSSTSRYGPSVQLSSVKGTALGKSITDPISEHFGVPSRASSPTEQIMPPSRVTSPAMGLSTAVAQIVEGSVKGA